MKTFTLSFILFISLTFLTLVSSGQAKSLTRENYESALNQAETKTDKQIRKEVSIQKLFADGKITETLTDINEHIPPDKSRWISVDDSPNGIKRIEEINIGNFNYRKENDGVWVKGENNDENYGLGGGAGKDNSTREYFIEEAKIGMEKFQVLIKKTVNFDKTYFDEDKTWINNKGLIIKRNLTTSYIEFKNIVNSIEITYDYKAKPSKIEAPIK